MFKEKKKQVDQIRQFNETINKFEQEQIDIVRQVKEKDRRIDELEAELFKLQKALGDERPSIPMPFKNLEEISEEKETEEREVEKADEATSANPDINSKKSRQAGGSSCLSGNLSERVAC